MKKYFIIYITALKNSFASRMAYRGDFFFSTFMIILSELLIPFITLLIYKTGASFPGWSISEVLLLQGVFLLSRGVAGLLFFGLIWNTLNSVREGSYDVLLIKPAPTLFVSIATSFQPDSIGVLLSGLMVCIYAQVSLPIPGFIQIFTFIALFILSLLVLFAFALLMAGSVFKWVGNSRVYEIFDSIVSFGNYPRSIFSKGFQSAISYVIPICAIGFLPSAALLGKELSGVGITVLVSVFFVVFSWMFWRKMLVNYTSAGG
jgi:ABC-2 type transport system permease protein